MTRREDLPAAVTFEVEPIELSPLYRTGLVVVAFAMLLLPLVYLGLVALVGYGVWYHTMNNYTVLLASGGGIGRVVAYVGPIVVGVLGILFMIKPLFAPKRQVLPPRTVSREEEPLVHAYIEALCASLGAPVPRRIDVDMQVNASASFRRGVGSFLGNDLVLTLGLPLTAGMSLGQLTGVLAHEFGHFTQGAAMRFSFVIGTVNHWFARVVYERDAWDDRLERWIAESSTGYGAAILAFSKGFIWLSRRILWLLMQIGGVVSGFMSRQMEYNADLHQARVSGGGLFKETHLRLPVLSAAWSQTTAYLGEMWRERRLVDDVVSLFLVEVDRLTGSPEVMQQLTEAVESEATGPLDTHPSTGDRIRAIEGGSHPPRLTDNRPASLLFGDFEGLCTESTRAFYEAVLGEPVQSVTLVPTDKAVTEQEGRIESGRALSNFFMDTELLSLGVAPKHPIGPAPELPGAAEELSALRQRMADSVTKVKEALGRLDELAAARMAAAVYVRTLDAGVGKKNAVRFNELRLEKGEDPDEHLARVDAALRAARDELADDVRVAARRMDVALAASAHETVARGISRASGTYERLPALTRVAQAIGAEWDSLRVINQLLPELGVLLQIAGPTIQPGPLLDEVLDVSKRLQERLGHLRTTLDGVPYPYEHAEEGISVGAFAVPELDPPHGPEIGHLASDASQALGGLYGRSWADLTALALEVEDLVAVTPPDLEAPPAPGAPPAP